MGRNFQTVLATELGFEPREMEVKGKGPIEGATFEHRVPFARAFTAQLPATRDGGTKSENQDCGSTAVDGVARAGRRLHSQPLDSSSARRSSARKSAAELLDDQFSRTSQTLSWLLARHGKGGAAGAGGASRAQDLNVPVSPARSGAAPSDAEVTLRVSRSLGAVARPCTGEFRLLPRGNKASECNREDHTQAAAGGAAAVMATELPQAESCARATDKGSHHGPDVVPNAIASHTGEIGCLSTAEPPCNDERLQVQSAVESGAVVVSNNVHAAAMWEEPTAAQSDAAAAVTASGGLHNTLLERSEDENVVQPSLTPKATSARAGQPSLHARAYDASGEMLLWSPESALKSGSVAALGTQEKDSSAPEELPSGSSAAVEDAGGDRKRSEPAEPTPAAGAGRDAPPERQDASTAEERSVAGEYAVEAKESALLNEEDDVDLTMSRLPISRVGQAHFAPRRRAQEPLNSRSRRAVPKRSSSDIGNDAGKVAELEAKMLQGDGPGTYVIIHNNTAITADMAAAPPTLSHLPAGESVDVVEVVFLAEDRRVRGRLEKQGGWISLRDTSDGYRWARPVKQGCLVPPVTTQRVPPTESRESHTAAEPGRTEIGSIVAEMASVHERLTLLFPDELVRGSELAAVSSTADARMELAESAAFGKGRRLKPSPLADLGSPAAVAEAARVEPGLNWSRAPGERPMFWPQSTGGPRSAPSGSVGIVGRSKSWHVLTSAASVPAPAAPAVARRGPQRRHRDDGHCGAAPAAGSEEDVVPPGPAVDGAPSRDASLEATFGGVEAFKPATPKHSKPDKREVSVTPRATVVLTPATTESVGTVCRKPRPKAMQRCTPRSDSLPGES
mmetsp:Transcript_67197/g.155970  ORF Transcript_67197/g.155970 Transcript_67197/m.155970 type:complete len:849 (+) Transcript_67197:104-2650(+)